MAANAAQETESSEDAADERLDLERLTTFFQFHVPGGVVGSLRARLIAGGRSNPTYEVADIEKRWVLRRPPYGHVLPTAHDMARESRVLRGLARTGVPVPRVVAFCEDQTVLGAPFYVMEHLDGTTLRTPDDALTLRRQERRLLAERMIDVLVDLHEVNPATIGLGDFGRPDGFLDRQLSRWRGQWERSRTRERPEVENLFDRLRVAMPESTHAGIVHGDYKIDNIMVDRDDPTRIVGVLDWEMSTLGDTLTDLGVLLSFWDEPGVPFHPITAGTTAVPGFPLREEVVARYSESRRVDVTGIDWYVVFAELKVAVILEGIHRRHLQGHTRGADFEGVGAMVSPLLERALRTANSSTIRLLREGR